MVRVTVVEVSRETSLAVRQPPATALVVSVRPWAVTGCSIGCLLTLDAGAGCMEPPGFVDVLEPAWLTSCSALLLGMVVAALPLPEAPMRSAPTAVATTAVGTRERFFMTI